MFFAKGTYLVEVWPRPAEIRSVCTLLKANIFAVFSEQDDGPSPHAPELPRVQYLGHDGGCAGKPARDQSARKHFAPIESRAE